MTRQFQPGVLRTIPCAEADGKFRAESGNALCLPCGYDTISLPAFQGRARTENPPPRQSVGEDLLEGKRLVAGGAGHSAVNILHQNGRDVKGTSAVGDSLCRAVEGQRHLVSGRLGLEHGTDVVEIGDLLAVNGNDNIALGDIFARCV